MEEETRGILNTTHSTLSVSLKHLCLSRTVLQPKEEILLLKQLLDRVQAHVDGVHVNQRLQNIGAQPSGTTCCFSVVEYAQQTVLTPAQCDR